MSGNNNATSLVNQAMVLARAAAYSIRASRTKAAVERTKSRFEDRAASAKYMSEAMTVLDVDDPTTNAYMEVFRLSTAMAQNVGGIVSAADALAVAAGELDAEARAQHGRMTDTNRTHNVQMAQPSFIKPR